MTRRVAAAAIFAPALAALLFTGALAGVRVARAGDVSALIGFGCHSSALCFAKLNQATLPSRALVYASGGYDGQFFYYLAAEAAGGPRATVDSDAFRRARMGLAWLVAPAYWIGPRALTFAFPLTLAAVHAVSAALLALRLRAAGAMTRTTRLALYAYALNPFAALAVLLSVADGLALALALIGLLALERGGVFSRGPVKQNGAGFTFCGLVALACAALTKETAVALIFAVSVLPALLAALSRRAAQSVLRSALYGAALGALMIAPTLLVWHNAGFSPALAAERGGAWFSGWLLYLSDADAFLSGRTMLAMLLPALAVFAPWCAVSAFVRLRAANQRGAAESGAPWMALAAAAAGGALLLGAAATADEYWSTYPNIQRLFSLSALALAAAAIAETLAPEELPASAARCERAILYILAALFLFGSLMLAKTELTGTMPLFFFLENAP